MIYAIIRAQIEADEVLPAFIRRKCRKQKHDVYPNRRTFGHYWERLVKKVWGADYCSSIDNFRKKKELAVVSSTVE